MPCGFRTDDFVTFYFSLCLSVSLWCVRVYVGAYLEGLMEARGHSHELFLHSYPPWFLRQGSLLTRSSPNKPG